MKIVRDRERQRERREEEGEKRRSNSKKRQRAGSKSAAAVMTFSGETVPWIRRDCTSRGSQRLRTSSLPSNLGERTPSSAPCGVVELQSKVGESQSHRWASRIRSHLRMRRTGHIECDTVTSLPRTHGIHNWHLPTPVSLAKHLSVLPSPSPTCWVLFFYDHLFLSARRALTPRSLSLRRVFTRWKQFEPPERLFGGFRRGTSASSDPSRPRSFP